MRFNAATSLTSLAAAPALARGFHVVSAPATARASTGLAARRSTLPILRRGDLFSHNVDRMFREMDEIMESSFATGFPRPSLPLLDSELRGGLTPRHRLGFDTSRNENGYKIDIRVPYAEAKDLDLQLDHDGRVLRLKGNKNSEDGGMKVRSRFEKAILLSPDVDVAKLTANMSGDLITVIAPKIERNAMQDMSKGRKIDIEVEEDATTQAQDGSKPTSDDTQKAPTKLAVDGLKNEKLDQKKIEEGAKKWPARDFPY